MGSLTRTSPPRFQLILLGFFARVLVLVYLYLLIDSLSLFAVAVLGMSFKAKVDWLRSNGDHHILNAGPRGNQHGESWAIPMDRMDSGDPSTPYGVLQYQWQVFCKKYSGVLW